VKAVYSELHRSHDPQFFLVRGVVKRTTEQPERADRLLAGLARASMSWSRLLCSGRGRAHVCTVSNIWISRIGLGRLVGARRRGA
jgi:hypothetical protein